MIAFDVVLKELIRSKYFTLSIKTGYSKNRTIRGDIKTQRELKKIMHEVGLTKEHKKEKSHLDRVLENKKKAPKGNFACKIKSG